MIEQVFTLEKSDVKRIDKMIMDDNVHYFHMVFNQNEGLPEHFANSNVYMTVLKGTLSIALGEQERKPYTERTVLKIPKGTKMNVGNQHPDQLEILVMKAPAPVM